MRCWRRRNPVPGTERTTPDWYNTPVVCVPCHHRHFRPPDRALLSPRQYLDMLATPRGYEWEPCRWVNYRRIRRKRRDLVSKRDKEYMGLLTRELWCLLTPDMKLRLKRVLTDDYGLSEKEAEELMAEREKTGGDATAAGGKARRGRWEWCRGTGPRTSPRYLWLRELTGLIALELSDYVLATVCARRTPRVRAIASAILDDVCRVTGERCTLSDPRTRMQRVMVLAADGLAIWLAGVESAVDGSKRRGKGASGRDGGRRAGAGPRGGRGYGGGRRAEAERRVDGGGEGKGKGKGAPPSEVRNRGGAKGKAGGGRGAPPAGIRDKASGPSDAKGKSDAEASDSRVRDKVSGAGPEAKGASGERKRERADEDGNPNPEGESAKADESPLRPGAAVSEARVRPAERRYALDESGNSVDGDESPRTVGGRPLLGPTTADRDGARVALYDREGNAAFADEKGNVYTADGTPVERDDAGNPLVFTEAGERVDVGRPPRARVYYAHGSAVRSDGNGVLLLLLLLLPDSSGRSPETDAEGRSRGPTPAPSGLAPPAVVDSKSAPARLTDARGNPVFLRPDGTPVYDDGAEVGAGPDGSPEVYDTKGNRVAAGRPGSGAAAGEKRPVSRRAVLADEDGRLVNLVNEFGNPVFLDDRGGLVCSDGSPVRSNVYGRPLVFDRRGNRLVADGDGRPKSLGGKTVRPATEAELERCEPSLSESSLVDGEGNPVRLRDEEGRPVYVGPDGALIDRKGSRLERGIGISDQDGRPVAVDDRGRPERLARAGFEAAQRPSPVAVLDRDGCPVALRDAEDRPVVSDSRGNLTTPDGKPLPTDGYGTPVLLAPDGSRVPLDRDGRPVGALLPSKSGSKLSESPGPGDSACRADVLDASGEEIRMRDEEGRPVYALKNASFVYADGTLVDLGPDGGPAVFTEAGLPVVADSDGRVRVDGRPARLAARRPPSPEDGRTFFDRHGKPVETVGEGGFETLDGCPVEADADGAPLVFDADGRRLDEWGLPVRGLRVSEERGEPPTPSPSPAGETLSLSDEDGNPVYSDSAGKPAAEIHPPERVRVGRVFELVDSDGRPIGLYDRGKKGVSTDERGNLVYPDGSAVEPEGAGRPLVLDREGDGLDVDGSARPVLTGKRSARFHDSERRPARGSRPGSAGGTSERDLGDVESAAPSKVWSGIAGSRRSCSGRCPCAPERTLERLKAWMMATPTERTERQGRVDSTLRRFLAAGRGSAEPPPALEEVTARVATWIDRLLREVEAEAGEGGSGRAGHAPSSERPAAGPEREREARDAVYEVRRRGEDGENLLKVKEASSLSVMETVAAGRGRAPGGAAPPRPQLASWARETSDLAALWLRWIERTVEKAEELRSRGGIGGASGGWGRRGSGPEWRRFEEAVAREAAAFARRKRKAKEDAPLPPP